jgi:cobyrinic acid a,c-diamide synthase
MIAAPTSASGKTTVTTGLLAALRHRGLHVSGHKVGPDYIDPGYHALAAHRPGRTLDPVLQGEQRVGPLLLHGAAGADLAVIEGVMGMFDGAAGRSGFGSSAHVARLTRTPVVLVVDVSRVGRSAGASVLGFATFDPEVTIQGVILNRVASARHEAELRASVAGLGIPVLGAVPRDNRVDLPSRHLGLLTADENQQAAQVVDLLADLMIKHLDLDALLALAHQAPPLPGPTWDPATALGGHVGGRPTVAMCSGPAFSFRYTEQVELLTAAGARVVDVDPLVDHELPPGTGALVVPGGYPEVHAAGLSANVSLRTTIARQVSDGLPVLAECGGLLYLLRCLVDLPMCGVIDAVAQMGERTVIGYRQALALHDGVAATTGEHVAGHEFHRTRTTPAAGQRPAWEWHDGAGVIREGFVHGSMHASYLHVHPAARPHAVLRFLESAS